MYLEVDRRDLAVSLRRRLGDWFKVVTLLKGTTGGTGGSDAEMEEAYNNCGDHYAELHRWGEAMPYFEKV
jgi:WD repeat-containing protein 35